jgi:hypothetical protein
LPTDVKQIDEWDGKDKKPEVLDDWDEDWGDEGYEYLISDKEEDDENG